MLAHGRTLKIQPRFGLGNRLLVLASGIRLVQLGLFGQLRVSWRPEKDLNCEIDKILDGPFVKDPYSQEDDDRSTVFVDYFQMSANTVRVPLLNHVTVRAFGVFTYEGDKTEPAAMTTQFKQALAKLRFHPDLVQKADRYDVAHRVGVHCRRTDFPAKMLGLDTDKAHVAMDLSMADALVTHFPDEPLFLATDCPRTDRYYKSRFGDRLIAASKSNYPDGSNRPEASIEEAVVDLLLLSRCRRLVADTFSTFSLVAGWLGGRDKSIWVTRDL